MSEVPWFIPGVVMSFVVALALSVRAGQVLNIRPAVAGALVVAFGVTVSATLTPGREALESGAIAARVCDLARIGLASLTDVVALNETGLNVLLFIPLGVAIGVVPGSPSRTVLAVGALAMPLAIELIQLNVPVFDRACESADVIDNLTGLVVGFFVGMSAGRGLTRSTSPNAGRKPR